MSKNDGIVNIHGKEYQTVALRVKNFRDTHKEHRLLTEIVFRDETCVVMMARIADPSGNVVATGHAEEYRESSTINKTSALENCETSAIGRALAAFGLGGTEFASADEVARAVSGQKGKPSPKEQVSPARRKIIEDTVVLIKDALNEQRDIDAYGYCEDFTDPDEKVYLWGFLDSKERSRLKSQAEVANRKAA